MVHQCVGRGSGHCAVPGLVEAGAQRWEGSSQRMVPRSWSPGTGGAGGQTWQAEGLLAGDFWKECVTSGRWALRSGPSHLGWHLCGPEEERRGPWGCGAGQVRRGGPEPGPEVQLIRGPTQSGREKEIQGSWSLAGFKTVFKLYRNIQRDNKSRWPPRDEEKRVRVSRLIIDNSSR